jgi:hypothetical protein
MFLHLIVHLYLRYPLSVIGNPLSVIGNPLSVIRYR